MPTVTHDSLSGADLHEPKGANSASAREVYVADGAGSGAWTLRDDRGWGYYANNAGAQSITASTAKLVNDGAGATTVTTRLPRSIRGSGQLWDTTNYKILPVAAGDSYDLRMNFTLGSTTGSPNYFKIELDIGGGASPTNVIATQFVDINNSPQSTGFPIFSESTFLSNGGTFFVSTDTGTVSLTTWAIFIKRDTYEV